MEKKMATVYVPSIVRLTSFIGYKKRKREWGEIKRVKQFV